VIGNERWPAALAHTFALSPCHFDTLKSGCLATGEEGNPTPEVRHRFVDTNGIRMHLAELGEGHWTQQERPNAVNAALLEFLAGL
jgi:pimeloyl-ACP methyl ester carboxylesterase